MRSAEHRMDANGDTNTPAFTIVVPTRNEAANVAELVRRLDAALSTTSAEVLFVDDSTDDTPDRVRAAAKRKSGLPVHLLHRRPGERSGGLGGAVMAGLRHARTEWCVIMDADLQHPPETVPTLIAAADDTVDLVVASRYCAGGGADGLSSGFRRGVSQWTTTLARRLFADTAGRCSDPMSGFFAVRRAAIELDGLRPSGFKILLEILVRTPKLRVAHVPFTFAQRVNGESKASPREAVRFLQELVHLRLAAPRTTREA